MFMLTKNEEIVLEITDITNEGNGVGRYDGVAVFVAGTAVGDVVNCKIVKVNKSYCYGIVTGFITKSPYRIGDNCPVSKSCGGCSFRHFTYEQECEVKNSFVKASFERIGKLYQQYEDFLGSERTSHYRNKAQYPVGFQDGKAVCGFYAKRSHRICAHIDCDLQPKIFAGITDCIMEYVNAYGIAPYDEQTGSGLLRHIYLRRGEHSGQIMLCLVVTSLSKAKCFDGLYSSITQEFDDIKSIVLNENPSST
ncbi:MAG: class I SAM-dependent RNA methyltransferase, partial [Ruminococcus sp.]|nr:class I SAM-dependent RNA methyltransferase [Ruminococcus sp.]